MADSTYINEIVEPVMRERLSAEIGVALRPKRMQIRWKIFDLASALVTLSG